MKPPHHKFTMGREVRGLLLQILNPHKGNDRTPQQNVFSIMVMNTQYTVSEGEFLKLCQLFFTVSCSDPTHEMRGSCDVWPITWASLTSITYFFSANNIGENTICSATLEIFGFSTMTHHFLASIWAISSQLWIQQAMNF